jgi:hypothetical protein
LNVSFFGESAEIISGSLSISIFLLGHSSSSLISGRFEPPRGGGGGGQNIKFKKVLKRGPGPVFLNLLKKVKKKK